MSYKYFDGDTFEREGHTFRVTYPYDESDDAPWGRSDCHGPVSGWTTRDKRPGERILCIDGRQRRFYDWQEAAKLARTKWGCTTDIQATLQQDFDYLRRWCNDQWQYLGVVVEMLNAEGEPIEQDSLWGIESDAYDYLAEVAHEIADGMLYTRKQAWRKALHEARERRYWAQRDVQTT